MSKHVLHDSINQKELENIILNSGKNLYQQFWFSLSVSAPVIEHFKKLFWECCTSGFDNR